MRHLLLEPIPAKDRVIRPLSLILSDTQLGFRSSLSKHLFPAPKSYPRYHDPVYSFGPTSNSWPSSTSPCLSICASYPVS